MYQENDYKRIKINDNNSYSLFEIKDIVDYLSRFLGWNDFINLRLLNKECNRWILNGSNHLTKKLPIVKTIDHLCNIKRLLKLFTIEYDYKNLRFYQIGQVIGIHDAKTVRPKYFNRFLGKRDHNLDFDDLGTT